MRATVLRGISGSGKTTWAEQQADAKIFSTDAYFVVDGEIRYDASKLGEYHGRNLRAFIEALQRQEAHVIADNTNINAWEYSPYVQAAQAFGYEVELMTFDCSVETSLARKQLVDAEKLRFIHDNFLRQTATMPRYFKAMHRVIKTD